MNNAIHVKNLKKDFLVSCSGKTSLSKLQHYFKPKYETMHVVNDVSFSIERGEKIAFIGPNGAGKSTTIKLLTGIFQPTSGEVRIFGIDPFSARKQVAYKIGVVFGQRSQLWYHLPAFHSFKLLAAIYNIDRQSFKSRLEHLSSLFKLERFMSRPIKELSLGERMRCELVASLLHHPEILFLDEPTIGLDLISKDAIRELIHQRVAIDSTTIFLTSHDISDIEKICDRIILINQGKIVIDDSVKNIKQRYLQYKQVTIKVDQQLDWKTHPAITSIQQTDSVYKFEVNLQQMTAQDALQHIAGNCRFKDITIEDSPFEEIVKRLFTKV
jgi:ABC-2 type transport system ATP-binding protein